METAGQKKEFVFRLKGRVHWEEVLAHGRQHILAPISLEQSWGMIIVTDERRCVVQRRRRLGTILAASSCPFV
ncbi:hypothetical protein SUGI_0195620 [Cryptomeria japonica]|nr:hypothetical protein SUGI_0195620 [Cryptomeria japonica]